MSPAAQICSTVVAPKPWVTNRSSAASATRLRASATRRARRPTDSCTLLRLVSVSPPPGGDVEKFDRTTMVMTAVTYDGMRDGCYDRDARVKDFTLNWCDGSLPFPTFPRFCGQTFYEASDKELALACIKAYNDWMVEEWCAPSRGFNIPLCIMPLWDVDLAAAEIQRNADRGVRAFCFSELPHHLKLPTIHSGSWDPVFQVCNDTGVTL